MLSKAGEFLQAQRSGEREALLKEVKEQLAAPAKLAQSEIPKIEEALSNGGLVWKGFFEGVDDNLLPSRAVWLKRSLDAYQQNPWTITAALEECKRLTAADLWGRRTDGRRDVNAAPRIIGSLKTRFKLADGCARAICKITDELQLIGQNFEAENLPVAIELRPPAADETITVRKKFDARALPSRAS